MSAAPLRIEVGRAVFEAASPEALAAIEAQNTQQRLPGLDDRHNPRIIDPAKWRALVQALAPDAAAALGGKPLALDGIGLRIATSSPTTPASFAPPVSLTPADDLGTSMTARTVVPYDCELARTQSAAARQRTQQADQAVTAATPGQIATIARRLRFAVALAWKENADAAAACARYDTGALADRLAAAKAAEDYALLGGSME